MYLDLLSMILALLGQTHLILCNHKTFHPLNNKDAGQFVQTHRLIFAIVCLTIYSFITPFDAFELSYI